MSEQVGWVEQLGQAVRAILTLMLGAGFVYLALRKDIGADLYSNIFAAIIGFWFGSRGATEAAKAVAAGGAGTGGTATTTVTPPSSTVTTVVQPPTEKP